MKYESTCLRQGQYVFQDKKLQVHVTLWFQVFDTIKYGNILNNNYMTNYIFKNN